MNEFMTDREYETCFTTFWGIRSKIASTLTSYGLRPGASVLDVPAGHGFLAYEIGRIIQQGTIHCVGLHNDLEAFQKFSHSQRTEEKYLNLITYHLMDATHLAFVSETFDFVVNFLGLEDINMTMGKAGVKQSLSEFVRVVKPGGIVQVTLCLEGDEPDQLIAKEVMQYVGCHAVFYPKDYYVNKLEEAGAQICTELWVHTHRKMTAGQAKEELQFACRETPRIFHTYHVRAVSFDDVWQRFGKRIETHGMAYYSDLCVLICQKHW